MKYDSVSKIDTFIDTNLFAFPYIDDVKDALEPGELDEINDFANNLKTMLKRINNNISKKEREELDFYPKKIKEMFDCIMFYHYEKPFFASLYKLLGKYQGYAGSLIYDFICKKEYDMGYLRYRGNQYLEHIKKLNDMVIRKESMKGYKRK